MSSRDSKVTDQPDAVFSEWDFLRAECVSPPWTWNYLLSDDQNLIRGHRPTAAFLCALDLLELDGEDLRREPIETRKSTLRSLLRGKHAGIVFNAHFTRMAQSSTGRLVRSAVRASCRSGWDPRIAPVAPTAG